ncbi:MAG: hypothetical protein AABX83_03135 [Nanoarchaeota archaeon]
MKISIIFFISLILISIAIVTISEKSLSPSERSDVVVKVDNQEQQPSSTTSSSSGGGGSSIELNNKTQTENKTSKEEENIINTDLKNQEEANTINTNLKEQKAEKNKSIRQRAMYNAIGLTLLIILITAIIVYMFIKLKNQDGKWKTKKEKS